jgi:hypothetical protein
VAATAELAASGGTDVQAAIAIRPKLLTTDRRRHRAII